MTTMAVVLGGVTVAEGFLLAFLDLGVGDGITLAVIHIYRVLFILGALAAMRCVRIRCPRTNWPCGS